MNTSVQDLQKTTAKVLVGLDIAKDSFDGAFLWQNSQRLIRRIKLSNTPSGHRALLKHIRRLVRSEDTLASLDDLHVVMEATGSYHLALAAALCEAGLTVSVVNPLQIKRFSQMRLRRAKTDRADALMIAEYGAGEPMRRYRMPPRAQQHLRQITQTLAQLVKQRTALGNVLHAARYLPEASSMCRQELEAVREAISESIKRLEKEQERLAREAYGQTYQLLRSIQGIGAKTAGAILGYGGDLSRFAKAKQFSALAGIVPHAWQSGQVDAPRHISKAGHAQLRTLLYMAATTAIRHNRACAALYERLRSRGKQHKVAVIAVANKLVRQVFGVVKSGVPYQDTYEEKLTLAA